MQAELSRQLEQLVGTYRSQCLWFLQDDFIPKDYASALRILGYIERYGDREAFNKVQQLKKCLLQDSNETSVA